MGHLLVRRREEEKKIKRTSRMWRKDRLSRINSTKKRDKGKRRGKREGRKERWENHGMKVSPVNKKCGWIGV